MTSQYTVDLTLGIWVFSNQFSLFASNFYCQVGRAYPSPTWRVIHSFYISWWLPTFRTTLGASGTKKLISIPSVSKRSPGLKENTGTWIITKAKVCTAILWWWTKTWEHRKGSYSFLLRDPRKASQEGWCSNSIVKSEHIFSMWK